MQQSLSPLEENYFNENLFETILQKLKETGISEVSRKDLAPVDEFHVRGAAVSMELAQEIGIAKNTHIIDIGCGIGGPGRMLAAEYECRVTGIDITEEFIRTANLLTELVGLQNNVIFIQANALELPFEPDSFDIAWTQHVQMNIKDKHRFYAEIKRVVKPGGKLMYYDIFSKNNQPIYFPMPWAKDQSASFLFTRDELHQLLSDLGFIKIQTRDQTKAGEEFFAMMFDKLAKEGPSKLGLHLIMGETTQPRLSNLLKCLQEGKLEIESGIYELPHKNA